MKRNPKPAPPLPPGAAKSIMSTVGSMVLAQAIADALEKGYVVQFIPGGDPQVWRDLALQAAPLVHRVAEEPDATPELRQAASLWLQTAADVRAAYTMAPPAADAPAAATQPEGT